MTIEKVGGKLLCTYSTNEVCSFGAEVTRDFEVDVVDPSIGSGCSERELSGTHGQPPGYFFATNWVRLEREREWERSVLYIPGAFSNSSNGGTPSRNS